MKMRWTGGYGGSHGACGGVGLLVGDKAFVLDEFGGTAVIGVVVVVFVDDGVNHDGLLVDCEDGVGGDGDPAFYAWISISIGRLKVAYAYLSRKSGAHWQPRQCQLPCLVDPSGNRLFRSYPPKSYQKNNTDLLPHRCGY